MNIEQLKKTLQQKKELLKKLVDEFAQTQQTQERLNQEILRTDGAIRQVEELIKQEEVTKKEDK